MLSDETLKLAYQAIESLQQELCAKEEPTEAEQTFLYQSINALVEISNARATTKFYIVGIDGSNTPDPLYWFQRFETIKAYNAAEARTKWIDKQIAAQWLRNDEIPYVHVWDELHKYTSPYNWMDKHIDENRKLTVKPIL